MLARVLVCWGRAGVLAWVLVLDRRFLDHAGAGAACGDGAGAVLDRRRRWIGVLFEHAGAVLVWVLVGAGWAFSSWRGGAGGVLVPDVWPWSLGAADGCVSLDAGGRHSGVLAQDVYIAVCGLGPARCVCNGGRCRVSLRIDACGRGGLGPARLCCCCCGAARRCLLLQSNPTPCIFMVSDSVAKGANRGGSNLNRQSSSAGSQAPGRKQPRAPD